MKARHPEKVKNPINPLKKKPNWIRSKIIDSKNDLGLDIDTSVIHEFKNETKHLNYIYGSSIDLIYQFFNIDNKINNVMSDSLFKFFKNKKIINNLATRFADTGLIF